MALAPITLVQLGMPIHITAAILSTYFYSPIAVFRTQAPLCLMCAISSPNHKHRGYLATISTRTMSHPTCTHTPSTIPWRTKKIPTLYTHKANGLEVLSFSSWLCTTACRFLLQQPLGHKQCGSSYYLLFHGIYILSCILVYLLHSSTLPWFQALCTERTPYSFQLQQCAQMESRKNYAKN